MIAKLGVFFNGILPQLLINQIVGTFLILHCYQYTKSGISGVYIACLDGFCWVNQGVGCYA